MMNFRIIKNSIINNVLQPSEAGRFRTVGAQKQSKSASEILDNLRQVTLYYASGDFPKISGRKSGPVPHDITFRVEMSVSKACEGDLSVLENPSSTEVQRAAALNEFKLAADLADESMDELFEIVFQILMSGVNLDMGLEKGILTDRWISNFNKDNPLPQGEFIVLTGSCALTMRTGEELAGEIGIPLSEIDQTNKLKDDPNLNSGVNVKE